jgi:hypothetical protein
MFSELSRHRRRVLSNPRVITSMSALLLLCLIVSSAAVSAPKFFLSRERDVSPLRIVYNDSDVGDPSNMVWKYKTIDFAWTKVEWSSSGNSWMEKDRLAILYMSLFIPFFSREGFCQNLAKELGSPSMVTLESITYSYGPFSCQVPLNSTQSASVILDYVNLVHKMFNGTNLLDQNTHGAAALGELEDMAAIFYIMFLGTSDYNTKYAAWTVYSKRFADSNSDIRKLLDMLILGYLVDTSSFLYHPDAPDIIRSEHTQSLGSVFEAVSKKFDKLSSILKSQSVQRVSFLIGAIVAVHSLSQNAEYSLQGFVDLLSSMAKSGVGNSPNLLVSVTETLSWLFTAGKEIYEKGWSVLTLDELRDVETHIEYFRLATDNIDMLDTFLVPAQFRRFVPEQRLETNIYELDRGTELLLIRLAGQFSQPCLDKSLKTRLGDLAKKLGAIRQEVIRKRTSQAERRCPFSVLVFGSSGIGKSMVTTMLRKVLCNYAKLSPDEAYVYNMSPTAKYWDGYRSSCHTIVMDDMATVKPESKIEDAMAPALIRVVNNMPFMPDQASLDNKGQQPCLARIVIGTTNTKDLNVFAQFSNPAAVLRRFPWVITPVLKDRYKNHAGRFKKPDIVVGEQPTAWVDAWDFIVEEVIVKPNKEKDGVDWKVVSRFSSLKELLPFVVNKMRIHESEQDQYINNRDSIIKSMCCAECFMPSCLCSCGKPPSQPSDPESESLEDEPDELDPDIFGADEPEPEIQEENAPRLRRVKGRTRRVKKIDLKYAHSLSVENIVESGLCQRLFEIGFLVALPFLFAKLFVFIYDKLCGLCRYVMGAYFYVVSVIANVDQTATNVSQRLQQVDSIVANPWSIVPGFRVPRLVVAHKNTLIVTAFIAALMVTLRIATTSGGSIKINEVQARPLEPLVTGKGATLDNPWVIPEVSGISEASKCAAGQSAEEKRCSLSSSAVALCTISSHGEFGQTQTAHCLRLKPGVILVNRHAVVESNMTLPTQVTVSMYSVFSNSRREKELVRDVSCKIVDIPNKDCVALVSPGLGSCVSIVDLFPKDPRVVLNGNINDCVILSRDPSFAIKCDKVKGEACTQALGSTPVASLKYTVTGSPPVKGDSGRPLWISLKSGGSIIAGLHSAYVNADGIEHFGCGAIVTQHDLSKISTVVSEMAILPAYAQSLEIEEPSRKSPFSESSASQPSIVDNFPDGFMNVNYFGRLVYRATGRAYAIKTASSKVCGRFCADAFRHIQEKLSIPFSYVSPISEKAMHWHWKPVVNFLKGVSEARATVDFQRLSAVKTMVMKRFSIAGMPQLEQLVHVLTDEDAINGCSGSFVERMKLSTSAGFPHAMPKSNLMEFDSDSEKWSFGPVLKAEVEAAVENLKVGKRTGLIFSAARKDEPKKLESLRKKGPRLFFCGNASQNFLLRKYFMSIVRLFMMHNEKFCTSVGMNAESVAWGKLFTRLCKHGESRIMAGDYSNFDSTMNVHFISLAWEIILELIKPYYSDEEFLIAQNLAREMIHPLIEIDGDLIQVIGSNPSGHALTTILNCVVNVLYLCYVFVGENPEADFFESVELTTYGDDNIMGISPDVSFGYTVVSSELAKIGVTYTTCDKRAVTEGLDNIRDVTFLKRWFRDGPGGRIFAALDLESVFRSTQIGVHSVFTTPDAVLSGIHNNAMCLDEEHRELFQEVTRRLAAVPLPTFAEFLDRFDKASQILDDFSDEFHLDEITGVQSCPYKIGVNVSGKRHISLFVALSHKRKQFISLRNVYTIKDVAGQRLVFALLPAELRMVKLVANNPQMPRGLLEFVNEQLGAAVGNGSLAF